MFGVGGRCFGVPKWGFLSSQSSSLHGATPFIAVFSVLFLVVGSIFFLKAKRTMQQGQVIEVNPAIVKLYGYGSAEEMMGSKLPERYVDPSDRELFFKELKETGAVRNFLFPNCRCRKMGHRPFV
jgi:PAS domain-containing protein